MGTAVIACVSVGITSPHRHLQDPDRNRLLDNRQLEPYLVSQSHRNSACM